MEKGFAYQHISCLTKRQKPTKMSLRAAGNGGMAISKRNFIHSDYQRILGTLNNKYFLAGTGLLGCTTHRLAF